MRWIYWIIQWCGRNWVFWRNTASWVVWGFPMKYQRFYSRFCSPFIVALLSFPTNISISARNPKSSPASSYSNHPQKSQKAISEPRLSQCSIQTNPSRTSGNHLKRFWRYCCWGDYERNDEDFAIVALKFSLFYRIFG